MTITFAAIRSKSMRAAALLIAVASCADPRSPTVPTANDSSVGAQPARMLGALDPAAMRPALAPQLIVRSTAAPSVESFAIDGFGPTAVVHVVNGDTHGDHRVTSATITIDGVIVAKPSSFSMSNAAFDIPVTLGNPSTLAVTTAGAPGTQLTISVDAQLATSAVAGAAGGTFEFLGSDVSLVLPAGVLGTTTPLTAAPVTPPGSGTIPGTSIELGPEGTVFAAPITVGIGFDPSVLPRGVKPDYLTMAWWNVDHWEPLPNQHVDALHNVVTATTEHFSEYALLPNAREFCPGDPSAESDLQAAIDDAPADGTVWLCDGQFTAAATVSKPLTLRAENPGQAALVQAPAATGTAAIVTVQGIPAGAGAVHMIGLAFRYSNYAIRTLDFDSLSVTGSTFDGASSWSAGMANTGIDIDLTSVPPTFVLIDDNTFSRGTMGVHDAQPVNIVVTNNLFKDQGYAGRQSFGVITSSATGGSNPIPGGGAPLERSARIEHNTFLNCGQASGACLALEQSGADTVRFNTMTMATGTTTDGIFVNRPGQLASNTSPALVTDNLLVGHSAIGDATVGTDWGFVNAIAMTVNPGLADEVARNTIDTAFVGVEMRNNSLAHFHDNAMTHMYIAWADFADRGAQLTATRNDVTDYVYPVTSTLPPAAAGAAGISAGALICNWWGSTSGPAGMLASVPVGAYTPFAMAPIANESSGVCP